MSRNTSRLTQAEQVLRSSLEYSAAFDLEVWKAQQQTLFREQLSKAKKRLEQKIRQQVEGEQAEMMHQLEITRAQLEQAAVALQEAQREQLRRSEGLDARERALEERRQRFAVQHEQNITRLEDENKRERERHRVTVEALENQLREKDRNALVLQDRLRAAEEAFETLRRRVSRYQLAGPLDEHETESMSPDKTHEEEEDELEVSAAGSPGGGGGCTRRRPRDRTRRVGSDQGQRQRLEDELVFAHATVQELNTTVRTQRDVLATHEKEREAMAAALRQREEQMIRLARKCHSLQETLQEREQAYLEEKKKELLGRERALEIRQMTLERAGGPVGGDGYRYESHECYASPLAGGPSRSDVVGAYARKPMPILPDGAPNIVDMISGLREEVAARLHHQQGKNTTSSKPAGSHRHRRSGLTRGAPLPRAAAHPIGRVPYTVAESPIATAVVGEDETETEPEGWDDEYTRQSDVGKRLAGEHCSESLSTITPRPVGQGGSTRRTAAPVPTRRSHPHAETSSSSSSSAEDEKDVEDSNDDEEDGNNTRDEESLLFHLSAAPRATTRTHAHARRPPPVPMSTPQTHTDNPSAGGNSSTGRASRAFSTSTSNSAISVPVARMSALRSPGGIPESALGPLPEEFVSANTISSETGRTAREEMEQFVQQLRLNRERLLETKVYAEDHPVIQEMTTKLELYQQYLREGAAAEIPSLPPFST